MFLRLLTLTLFVVFVFSGCKASEVNTPDESENVAPSSSAAATPSAPSLDSVPEAIKLDMPKITEAGFDIYGTAWINDDLLLIMSQKEGKDDWEYMLNAYNIKTGAIYDFKNNNENYGWFGRVLSDGRLCMYDYDRCIFFNTNDFTREDINEYPASVSIAEIDVSPDGKKIAFTDMEDGNLYVSDIEFKQTKCVVKAAEDAQDTGMGRPSTPLWSADGNWLYYEIYGGDNVTINVIGADGSNEKVLAEVPECSFHLLKDGRFLMLGFQGELKSFDPANGEITQLLPGKEYLPISWDHGGKYAAAVLIGEKENDSLMLFDLKNGSELKHWELPQYAPIYFDFDSFSPDGTKFVFLYADEEGQNACYLLDLN